MRSASFVNREFPTHIPLIEADDGESAVELAIEHRPAFSILDIQMPKLSGVKAARTIWRTFPEARVIFWTQFLHEIYINGDPQDRPLDKTAADLWIYSQKQSGG
ncbi:MAG: response regulator [Pyrinomonadaceae bacterium]